MKRKNYGRVGPSKENKPAFFLPKHCRPVRSLHYHLGASGFLQLNPGLSPESRSFWLLHSGLQLPFNQKALGRLELTPYRVLVEDVAQHRRVR